MIMTRKNNWGKEKTPPEMKWKDGKENGRHLSMMAKLKIINNYHHLSLPSLGGHIRPSLYFYKSAFRWMQILWPTQPNQYQSSIKLLCPVCEITDSNPAHANIQDHIVKYQRKECYFFHNIITTNSAPSCNRFGCHSKYKKKCNQNCYGHLICFNLQYIQKK